MYRENNRRKGFLGALIGGLIGLLGSGISAGIGAASARKSREQQEEIYRQQQIEQNQADTLNQSAQLTNKYAQQDNSDFYNKITYGNNKFTNETTSPQFRKGGTKSGYGNDIVKQVLRNSPVEVSSTSTYACGGRKKAAYGTDDYPIYNDNDVQYIENATDIDAIDKAIADAIYVDRVRDRALEYMAGYNPVTTLENAYRGINYLLNTDMGEIRNQVREHNKVRRDNIGRLREYLRNRNDELKCGGRRKKEDGGSEDENLEDIGFSEWTPSDTNSIINSGFGALGNMINAGVNFATKDYTVRRVKRGVPFRLTNRNRYDDMSNNGW